MALSVASTLRSEGGRTVRDAEGFKVAKWAMSQPREPMTYTREAHTFAPAPASGRRIIGLTHNYDVGNQGHKEMVVARPVRNRHILDRQPVAERRQFVDHRAERELRTDLREREYIDEDVYSHVEHVPVRVQERVVHRTREVPKPVPVPQYIEVPKPYPVERIVEVPKYVEKRVEVPVEVERVVEVPCPYPVEVIKRVEVPVEIERVVEKLVPVDRPVHVQHRVEVPVREEIYREIERPVRDHVPVHVADPRQSAAIADLQRELNSAHGELARVRHGEFESHHRGVAYHHEEDVVRSSRRGVAHHVAPGAHHHYEVPAYSHDLQGMRGRMPADDGLLHQHPTAKWGRQHDIPGRRPYPADPFYRLHADRR